MNHALRVGFASLTLFVAACHGKQQCADHFADRSTNGRPSNDGVQYAPGGNSAPAPSEVGTAAGAARAVSEADIVQLDDEQDRIYAISRSGTLAVIDAATPGSLSLLGKTGISGVPFEMYRRGDILITMANNGLSGSGDVRAPLPEGAAPPPADAASGSVISAVDVHDPASMKTLATFKVPGEIADSRVVGHILYLATYENVACWSCGAKPRTLVTSFDISIPSAPVKVDQIAFESDPNTLGGFASFPTSWKRSIVATTNRLYVGGLSYDPVITTDEGVIEVVDIADPSGKLTHGATISTAGPIASRWQMDEYDGILRVVSQRGAGRTENGEKYPDVDTFRVESSSSLVRVGHTTLRLPQQEGLKSVRFDGTRGYVITFLQRTVRPRDPLFTVDLSDPKKPTQKGELEMPGWVFHLEARGDKLLGLGLDRENTAGILNVSLFDVADMTKPTLLQRENFGPTGGGFVYTDDMITQGVLAEDQDRIRKAFRIDQDGLIAVPYSAGLNVCSWDPNADSNTINVGPESGIQLLRWSANSLTKGGFLPLPGNPRRALRRESPGTTEIIGISDSHARAFSLSSPAIRGAQAEVRIGHCVPRTIVPTASGGGGGWASGDTWNEGRGEGRYYDSHGSCE
ncbi:MAG TPA: beta-propeller domain-containing protein [Labilithrix sp.]|nr:beta-propeller domain-containing protein [Labilithrix sp.]